MSTTALDPQMIEALEGASSLQLYQLKAIIERMLAEPKRGLSRPLLPPPRLASSSKATPSPSRIARAATSPA